MGSANVWILGGYQSDFARNLTREGHDFADLTAEVVDSTLAATKVDASEIDVVHLGNAFGEMFARQGHLGAMPATVNDGLWDTPASRHEAACASGSVATLAAIADLRSGAYRTALVVGVELEKTVPGDTAAQYLGAAAWTDHEGADAKFMWPHMFDQVTAEYDRRYGIDETHLRAIAQLNFANARANPNAQTREWTVPDPLTGDDEDQPRRRRPVASLRLQPDDRRRRRESSSSPTNGCAITPARARSGGSTAGATAPSAWACSRSSTIPPTIRTSCPTYDGRCSTRSTALRSPSTTSTASRCTTASPPASIWPSITSASPDPGESWKAIENNEIEIGGRLPINPSGGLIGGGHPVGASGVRMLLDAAKQVSDGAGDYQVEGAKTFGTLNFGGSTATTVSFVVSGV